MQALRGIDLRIREGDFVAVMGPSGSGKSACMNILGCRDTPSSGSYFFQGVEIGMNKYYDWGDYHERLKTVYSSKLFQACVNVLRRPHHIRHLAFRMRCCRA